MSRATQGTHEHTGSTLGSPAAALSLSAAAVIELDLFLIVRLFLSS
eukprot:CAMPEP_0118871004 /NCGR_PEP_ID=MMETSP1163-20130328/13751_1 /TAXON_ID=124430 /ORGANISM="Phaeomonas parva, Strain CCMP2877" /LENGTH=45 /DNA_ID= /DNA_START= /DNA_END= /DNA_ORIENTATION=